jgi:tRNA threonylcarbamoyladenosine biosynthesis protein TsaE
MDVVTGRPARLSAGATTGAGPGALTLTTDSAEGTRRLAASLAPLCLPGDVLLLAGDLGAGKTTFAQGFAAGLGIAGAVTSPTFVLVHQYPVQGRPPVRVLLHADVYRLDHLHEIADLGLAELVEDGGVALVEWGDAAQPVLGSGALVVRLAAADDDQRRAVVVAPTDDAWSDRWDRLTAAVAPWVDRP